jgi:hypothetical protein
MKKQQKKFTVVLRYPDYYTDTWPDDTYTEVVEAMSREKAVLKLQKQLCRRINRGDCQIEDPTDLAAIIVVEGAPKIWVYESPCRFLRIFK